MKRFNELTKDEQAQAVVYAKNELVDCIERGLISFTKPLGEDALQDYAQVAAEEAWYSEPGDKVIADIVE